MFVKLHKISKSQNGEWYLSEMHLNADKVVYMAENNEMKTLLEEGKLNLGLLSNHSFTTIRINSSSGIEEIVVVGNPTTIESKMLKSNKHLLRG